MIYRGAPTTPTYTWPRSTASPADTRLWAGFSLFAAWLIILPRTVIANSTVVFGNAFTTGCLFVALFAGLSALDAVRAKRGERVWFTACSLTGTIAGFAFIALPGVPEHLVFFGLEMAAGSGLLLHWGRVLCDRPLKFIAACAVGVLGMAGIAHFAIALLGFAVSPLGMLGNAHAFSDFTLGVLALLPLASGVLVWGGKGCVVSCDTIHPYTDVPRTSSNREMAKSLLPYATILCLASLATSFISGFTYLPHYIDWNIAACLRSGIALIAAVAAGWYLLKQYTFTLAKANRFLLFSLLLTVFGLSLLTISNPSLAIVARGMLDAARDCYFAVALILFCGLIRECRLPFFPFFSLGMLGTGLYWGYDLGVFTKRLLGYDVYILAPIAAVCIAVLAGAFFLLSARESGRMGAPLSKQNNAAENHLQAQDDTTGLMVQVDEPATNAVPDISPDTPLNAASARQIIEKTHEDILAPYQLSPRELQVSLLVLEGYTAAAISEKLDISIATVKFHLGNTYRKIGIQSKSELVQLTKEHEGNTTDETLGDTPYAQ